MSGENATVRGANKEPIKASPDGHFETESTFPLLKLPKRKRIGRTPIKLDNVPCALVYIQNPIDNPTVYVGGVGDDTVTLDKNYTGDTDGAILYEGMTMPFQVENANLLTVVSEAENTTIVYWTYLNQKTDQPLDRDDLPAVDTTRPFVQSHNPLAGQTDVERNIPIQINMNEAIDATTVNSTNITVSPTITATYTVNEASPSQIVITPSADLAAATTYTVALQPLSIKDLAGNSLASLYSFNFTTKAAAPPPDTTPPTITARSPGVSATGVSINAAVVIDWDEALSAASVNTTTCQISIITGESVTLSNLNKRITITPAAPLAFSTTYTVTLTTGIEDVALNNIPTQIQWTFTTAAAPDVTPPTVTTSNPLNNATNVAVTVDPTITFSEALNPAFVNPNTILFVNNETAQAVPNYTATLSAGNTVVTLTPSANLPTDTVDGIQYRITITTSVKDVAGNQFAGAQNIVFRTAVGADVTPPAIVTGTSTPTAGEVGVAINKIITINWDEALNPSSVTNTTFNLKINSSGATVPHTSALVAGTNNQRVDITPSSLLAYNTQYRVEVTTAVEDVAGNNITSQINRLFTTQLQTDTTPPTIVSKTPDSGAQGVSVSTNVVITFNEGLDINSVHANVFELFLTSSMGELATQVVRESNDTVVRIIPSSSLVNGTSYTVRIRRNDVRDKAGNAMTGGNLDWQFVTASLPLVLQYNVSGSGSWNPLGFGSSNGEDRQGRGIRQKSTSTSNGSLFNKPPKRASFWLRRAGNFDSGEDDNLWCRIRDSNGNLKATIGSYSNATSITEDSGGQKITFENTGQTVTMQQNDSLLVEYADGDADNEFQILSASQSGGGPNSHCVEVYYENEDTDDFSEQTDRDVAAEVYV